VQVVGSRSRRPIRTEESKTQKPKVEELELNRETIQELTEREAEQGRGGAVPRTPKGVDQCAFNQSTCI